MTTTGSITSPAGTFAPGVSQGARLNPFLDRKPWGKVTIGNLELPGIVESIDGAERPEVWAIQMGISVSGAVTVWRGTSLAEEIKILLKLHNAAAFDAYYDVRDKLRPKIGKKPPAHNIVNAAINFSGITQIACRNVGAPKWVAQGGYWTGLVTLVQYGKPRPVVAGTVEPPKPTAEDPANVKAAAELQSALDDLAVEQGRSARP